MSKEDVGFWSIGRSFGWGWVFVRQPCSCTASQTDLMGGSVSRDRAYGFAESSTSDAAGYADSAPLAWLADRPDLADHEIADASSGCGKRLLTGPVVRGSNGLARYRVSSSDFPWLRRRHGKAVDIEPAHRSLRVLFRRSCLRLHVGEGPILPSFPNAREIDRAPLV